MKTTVELPDGLMREIRIRAFQQGRKPKDLVAELLRKALDDTGSSGPQIERSCIERDERTGLPVIKCHHAAAPGQTLTPDRIAAILLD